MIRWLERDGETVLQYQKRDVTTGHDLWQDVPLVTEERKVEVTVQGLREAFEKAHKTWDSNGVASYPYGLCSYLAKELGLED